MKDRLSKYPGRVKLTPVAGQADTFDMIRADEPENEGTPLNKNSLLKDETAEAMGLDPETNPTPNDALAALMARMLADGNGIMQKMMQMLKGDSNVGIMNGENNKIFGYGVDGKFYTGDPEYPLAFLGSAANPTYNGKGLALATELAALVTEVGGKAKVQTGTYTGTGKTGSSNKNSLTFNFVPLLIFIISRNDRGYVTECAMMPSSGEAVVLENTNGRYVRGLNPVSIAGTTVSWYTDTTTEPAYLQMNWAEATYHYVAIG